MKLVAVVENVKQKCNENLIGQIIVVNSDLVWSRDDELCYLECTDFDNWVSGQRTLRQCLSIYHVVNNVEIIGVL